MKMKSFTVGLPYGWETLKLLLSEPEKTLPFFPYFESLTGRSRTSSPLGGEV